MAIFQFCPCHYRVRHDECAARTNEAKRCARSCFGLRKPRKVCTTTTRTTIHPDRCPECVRQGLHVPPPPVKDDPRVVSARLAERTAFRAAASARRQAAEAGLPILPSSRPDGLMGPVLGRTPPPRLQDRPFLVPSALDRSTSFSRPRRCPDIPAPLRIAKVFVRADERLTSSFVEMGAVSPVTPAAVRRPVSPVSHMYTFYDDTSP